MEYNLLSGLNIKLYFKNRVQIHINTMRSGNAKVNFEKLSSTLMWYVFMQRITKFPDYISFLLNNKTLKYL